MDKNFAINESADSIKGAQEIYMGYLNIMFKCASDQAYYDRFQVNTREMLNDEAKMSIPEDVDVVLNSELRHPILSLKSQNPDGSEFVIKEMELGVEVSEMWKSGEMEAEIAKFSGDSSVEVQIGSPSSQFKKEIQMPFIDVTKDVLSEVKFTDGTEIILTCC